MMKINGLLVKLWGILEGSILNTIEIQFDKVVKVYDFVNPLSHRGRAFHYLYLGDSPRLIDIG